MEMDFGGAAAATLQPVERAWRSMQWMLESHGWKLLTLVLLFYVLRQKYCAFAADRHKQRILAAANDPTRVKLLQRETARVRRSQQKQLQETTKTATHQPRKHR